MAHMEQVALEPEPEAWLLAAVEMVATVATASVSSHILNKGLKT